MTTIREAIARSTATVLLNRNGDAWYVSYWDGDLRAWREVPVSDFNAGQATRREIMIRIALERLFVSDAGERAHRAAQESDDWRKLLRREHKAYRDSKLLARAMQ